MLFLSKGSNVDLNDKKINFHKFALDKVGGLLKDLSVLTNDEVNILFKLFFVLIDDSKNDIELNDKDMEFVRKYIGDIK